MDRHTSTTKQLSANAKRKELRVIKQVHLSRLWTDTQVQDPNQKLEEFKLDAQSSKTKLAKNSEVAT